VDNINSTSSLFNLSVPKLCVSLACLLALSACGGGGGSTPASTSTGGTTTSGGTTGGGTTGGGTTGGGTTGGGTTPTALSTIYVTNNDATAGTVLKCSLNATTGATENCTTQQGTYQNPAGITVNGNYAYITNYGANTIQQCTIGSDGSLSSCADAGAAGLNGPTDIQFKNNFAYIVNNLGSKTVLNSDGTTNTWVGSVSQCSVDASTGVLSNCHDLNVPITSAPVTIGFTDQYAFIVNNGDSSLNVCSLDATTGALSSCKKPITTGLTSPYGVTVNGSFLNIVNQGAANTTTGVVTAQSTISTCPISSDPAATTLNVVGTCTSQPIDTTSTTWDKARRILFTGSSAYITAMNAGAATPAGQLLKCSVDSTSGAISGCAADAGSFPNASGVAIKQ
jgi:hypothetical protein